MHTVYLAGFNTQSERALRSFFSGIPGRPTGWTAVDSATGAEAILVFAPNRETFAQVQALAEPTQEIVLVGNSDFGSGWLLVPRPATPSSILQGLNQAMHIKHQGADSVVNWDDSRLDGTASLPLTRQTRHGDLRPAHLPDRELSKEIRAIKERLERGQVD